MIVDGTFVVVVGVVFGFQLLPLVTMIIFILPLLLLSLVVLLVLLSSTVVAFGGGGGRAVTLGVVVDFAGVVVVGSGGGTATGALFVCVHDIVTMVARTRAKNALPPLASPSRCLSRQPSV